jgi:hypothetical protein
MKLGSGSTTTTTMHASSGERQFGWVQEMPRGVLLIHLAGLALLPGLLVLMVEGIAELWIHTSFLNPHDLSILFPLLSFLASYVWLPIASGVLLWRTVKRRRVHSLEWLLLAIVGASVLALVVASRTMT